MRKKQECYASNYELAELFQKMQIPMYVIFATLWQEFGMCLFNHFVRSRSSDAWKYPEPILLAEVCYIVFNVFFLDASKQSRLLRDVEFRCYILKN